MRQTLFVEPNQKQQILALVKSMAKLPWFVTEPGFHPENKWICVIVELVWAVGLCRHFQLPFHIFSATSISYFSSFTISYVFHSFGSFFWSPLTSAPLWSFLLLLFFDIFLVKPFNASLTMSRQFSGFPSIVHILNNFSISVVESCYHFFLFLMFLICAVASWLSWGLTVFIPFFTSILS